jgi:hypothetical protein
VGYQYGLGSSWHLLALDFWTLGLSSCNLGNL